MLSGKKWRKCFVLRQVEIPMSKLVEGDIFRLEKTTRDDCVNENRYSIAKSDAYSESEPFGNHGVKADFISFSIPNPEKIAILLLLNVTEQ